VATFQTLLRQMCCGFWCGIDNRATLTAISIDGLA